MDRPVPVVLVPLLFLVALGPAVPARPLQRPGREHPALDVPSRLAYDTLLGEFPEGEFGPLMLAVQTDGPVTDPANMGLAVRLLPAARR